MIRHWGIGGYLIVTWYKCCPRFEISHRARSRFAEAVRGDIRWVRDHNVPCKLAPFACIVFENVILNEANLLLSAWSQMPKPDVMLYILFYKCCSIDRDVHAK